MVSGREFLSDGCEAVVQKIAIALPEVADQGGRCLRVGGRRAQNHPGEGEQRGARAEARCMAPEAGGPRAWPTEQAPDSGTPPVARLFGLRRGGSKSLGCAPIDGCGHMRGYRTNSKETQLHGTAGHAWKRPVSASRAPGVSHASEPGQTSRTASGMAADHLHGSRGCHAAQASWEPYRFIAAKRAKIQSRGAPDFHQLM